ncbi:MAG: DNA repair protein RecO [Chloroflexi bacterium]|nr:DNA repair protein RecO [Chloroflexota bacterium]
MTRPRVYKTEAIVLKGMDLGEADKILTLYTPYLGKLSAVARGVRRPKSKLGGHLDLLTHSQLLLAQGKSLDVITQAQTLDSFLPLRQNLWLTGCALYAAELIDRFTAERVENPALYRLLLNALNWLIQTLDANLTLRYFELHLLELLGYRPQLQQCPLCQTQLKPTTNFFSPAHGGVLCPSCGTLEAEARPISLNTLKVMRYLQGNDYGIASKLRLDGGLAKELETTMGGYIRFHLEHEVKSVAFLNDLRRQEAKAHPFGPLSPGLRQ